MWRSFILNDDTTYPYGFGWELAETIHGMRVVKHSETWQGFQSIIIRVLDVKVTIVIFANLDAVDVEEMASHVLEIYNPQLALISEDDE
ncbi:unnamed protein product [Rotaria sp. Silwood1]|nr:unnamed protein product [Rotaria sp. Silwood1]CAF1559986.1 unnamed protein product [Rotaria sp. Silwood1]CAF3670663.1 unnamed protein product [Rotaria sp. Silwood1]CAF3705892.1 unnamed protein product [Rotaria sp. Silwood1]CAF3722159.1 unnamed protein product [Rotaria sp. Silwood1]